MSKTVTNQVLVVLLSTTWLAVGCGKKTDKTPAKSTKVAPASAPKVDAKPKAPANPAGAVPATARVFFVEPKDGANLVGIVKDGLVAVKVKMGLEGMKLRPAGQIVEHTGHHHILINTELTKMGMPVKKDAQHLHFGKAQSEAEIFLKPGKHELSLQFANGAHLSYGPKMSASIGVTVTAAPTPASGDKPASADVPVDQDKVPPTPKTPPEPDPNLKK
ncbi:MAG TPA: hypothetical protein DCQ06_00740 [Myxococcales bacterium]|nr:hypothetical protein [Myxococcales bacterium]HAN30098.1 hypothetical protein [Myxococcales bacterium]